MKTRGFDFGGAFYIFRGMGQRHRQMELFSLQMFDNERGERSWGAVMKGLGREMKYPGTKAPVEAGD